MVSIKNIRTLISEIANPQSTYPKTLQAAQQGKIRLEKGWEFPSSSGYPQPGESLFL